MGSSIGKLIRCQAILWKKRIRMSNSWQTERNEKQMSAEKRVNLIWEYFRRTKFWTREQRIRGISLWRTKLPESEFLKEILSGIFWRTIKDLYHIGKDRNLAKWAHKFLPYKLNTHAYTESYSMDPYYSSERTEVNKEGCLRQSKSYALNIR